MDGWRTASKLKEQQTEPLGWSCAWAVGGVRAEGKAERERVRSRSELLSLGHKEASHETKRHAGHREDLELPARETGNLWRVSTHVLKRLLSGARL